MDSDYSRSVGIAHQLTEFDGCGIMNRFKRITFNPNIMGGQACIRSMRIPVSLVINLVAYGMTTDEIIKEYPSLELDDIRESLQYNSWLAKDELHPTGGDGNVYCEDNKAWPGNYS